MVLVRVNLPITTERLVLRPYQMSDVDDVFAYQSLEDIARFQFWTERSRDEVAEKVAEWQQALGRWDQDDALALAIALRESDQVIGDCVLLFRDKEARQGEIGYTLNPAFQGKGYATEAALALLRVGFEDLNLHRIYARCDARNTGSWKLMERLGLRREAHFREHAIFKGEWDEEFYYALLQREWQERN